MDALEPFKVDICYLDSEDISPDIFMSAVQGIAIIVNDEESLYDATIKNVHLYEGLRLVGIAK